MLVFTSEPLKVTTALTGKITASLFVSTLGANDTDWTVKITDVYPGRGRGVDGVDGAATLSTDISCVLPTFPFV